MQVIIRFSLDNDVNSALRNALRGILLGAGFTDGENTATYRHAHIEPAQMSDVLRDYWHRAATHGGNGRVDHFWMYTDRGFLDEMLAPAAAVVPG